MYVLVVYESMFGNTEAVARAIGEGLAEHVQVRVAQVSQWPDATGADAVVVGAPTHAFGLSRPATRADAVRQGAAASPEVGVREWLATLARPGLAAAFDTRIANPLLPGSAAKKVVRTLARAGWRLVVPAESFFVGGTKGPLRNGEFDRARRWGAELAARITAPQPLG
ncbi:flavodoxin domain-containing protein [Micromonospora sp. NPDC049891]|uniref:flavodoxin family protein n=1 Tax=Micromonospora sp. NPDC049891 TaxID=3155655 RepID=UPI0033E5EF7F